MSSYTSLDKLFAQDLSELMKREENKMELFKAIDSEISAINRNMVHLHTSKEKQSLPDLMILRDYTMTLQEPHNNFDKNTNQCEQIKNLVVRELFSRVCFTVLKTRIYHEIKIVNTSDEIFKNLVRWGTQNIRGQEEFILEMLTVIININGEFYKNNGKERVDQFPFGEKLENVDFGEEWFKSLKKGDKVDAYCGSFKNKTWVPAQIYSIDDKTTRVKYLYDNTEYYLSKPQFELRPYEDKKNLYQWREELKVGDQIDKINYQSVWMTYTIQEINEEENEDCYGGKKVKLKILQDNPEYDYLNNASYENLYSSSIAPGNTFSKSKSQLNDSKDEFYLKQINVKKYAILRESEGATGSSFLVNYINIFGQFGGFDLIFDSLNKNKEIEDKILNYYVQLINSSVKNFVKPFIQEHGSQLLELISEQLIHSSQMNLRNVDKSFLNTYIEAIKCLSMRIYSGEKSKEFNDKIQLELGLVCLKSQFLNKQFFGVKILEKILKSVRIHSQRLEQQSKLAQIFEKENIFNILIKAHPSLIQKSHNIIKLFFQQDLIQRNQLNSLWEQIIKTDLESRNSLLNVLKSCISDFKEEDLLFLLTKMEESILSIANQELIDLLFQVKNFGTHSFENQDFQKRANEIIFNIIQSDQEIKKELLKDLMEKFAKYLENANQQEFINKIINNYQNEKQQLRNLKMLKKLLGRDIDTRENVFNSLKELKMVNFILEEVIVAIQSKNKQSRIVQFSEREKKIMKNRLKFLILIKKKFPYRQLIQFSSLVRVWREIFNAKIDTKEVFDWLKSQIVSEREEQINQDHIEFFMENIKKFKESPKNDLFSFFVLLFYKINLSKGKFIKEEIQMEKYNNYMSSNTQKKSYFVLNTQIEKLIGIQQIQDLFLETEDEKLEDSIAFYLAKFYSRPETLIETNHSLYSEEIPKIYDQCCDWLKQNCAVKARKSSKLLYLMMKREENRGKGYLKSWSQFQCLPSIAFVLEKSGYYKNTTSVMMPLNATLGELRKKVAKEFDMIYNQVSLEAGEGVDLKKTNDCMTLEDILKLKHFKRIEVKQSESPVIPESSLFNEQGDDFNDNVYQIFKEIFEEFSKNGKMTPEDMARFTTQATDGIYCSPNDNRIQQVFENYAEENPESLNEQEFVKFYLSCALKSESKHETVKQNLISLGYDQTFTPKYLNDTQKKIKSVEQSIRYKISLDQELFENLIKFLENEKSKEAIWNLLSFSSPNFEILKDCLNSPLKLFRNSNLSEEMAYYYLNILEAMIFKQEWVLSLISLYLDYDQPESQVAVFYNKVYSMKLWQALIDYTQNKRLEFQKNQKIIKSTYHILDILLIVLLDFKNENYIKDMSSFITYWYQLKKQNKQNKEIQSKVIYGPQQKEEQDKKEEKNETKTRQESKEVILMKQIKNSLIDINFEIDQLSQNMKISTKGIVEKCFHMLDQQLQQNFTENYTQKKKIIKYLVTFTLGCLMINQEILKDLLDDETLQFKKILFSGLVCQKNVIRLYFKNFYVFLTKKIKDEKLQSQFLELIMKGITDSNQDNNMHFLIDLASILLLEVNQNSDKIQMKNGFDLKSLLMSVINKLLNYDSQELYYDGKEDSTLIQMIIFISRILTSDQEMTKEIDVKTKRKMIDFLFTECLFNVSEKDINLQLCKCKSNKSREKAIELLVQLLNKDIKSVMYVFLKGLTPLKKYLPLSYQSKYNYKKDTNQTGYLGIRNPGCICYMNAMLQQFYCIPTFRYGLLLADDYKEEEEFELEQYYKIDDNVFHQMQKMFAYLDISQRSDFNPKDFCGSYKDYSGQRVNVMVQQDAQEFLNMIFDKLESSLKPSPFQGILDSVFRGKICHVFTCKGCGFIRSKEEIYYNLSLEVKNMDNIEESFDKFKKKETISDYMCDNCKTKCDITKQCFLTELPNVLIIHLQKIIFDLETLMNIKISSKYKFPHNLNLKGNMLDPAMFGDKELKMDTKLRRKISTEILEEDYEYKLVGVVIHRGNANFGHYTSLINVNRNDPNRPEYNEDTWLNFDDSNVSKFDMENFEEECFGMKYEREYPSSMMEIDHNFSKSAYILVYDKVKKRNLKLKFEDQNMKELDKVKSNLIKKENFKLNDNILETNFYNLNKFIPQKYDQMIKTDNISLILENQLFCANFTGSFAQILNNIDLPQVTIGMPIPKLTQYQTFMCDMILKTVPDYFFKIFCVSFYNYHICKISKVLCSALILKQDNILEFFETNIYNNFIQISNLIMNTNSNNVLTALSEFVTTTFTVLIQKYNINFEPVNKPIEDQNEQESVQYKFYQVWDYMLKLIPNECTDSKQFKQMCCFFITIHKVMSFNHQLTKKMLHHNYLSKVYDLYMYQSKQSHRNFEKAMNSLLGIIYLFLRQMKQLIEDSDEGYQKQQMQDYYEHKVRIEFFISIMTEDFKFDGFQQLSLLIDLVCRDNLEMSIQLTLKSIKALSEVSDSLSIGYLYSLHYLLLIKDQYQHQRIRMILGVPQLQEKKIKCEETKRYLYGIGKELQLESKIFNMINPFGGYKSLVGTFLKFQGMSDSSALLCMHFILLSANLDQKVFEYLLHLPPISYQQSNFLEYLKEYLDKSIETIKKSYQQPQPELMYNYINNLPEMAMEFNNKVQQYAQAHQLIKEGEVFNYYSGLIPQKIDSINKNYMIGRTVNSQKIFTKEIAQDLTLKIHLNFVCVQEYTSNGDTNSVFEEEELSIKNYLNKTEISQNLRKFIGEDHSYPYVNKSSQYQIKAIGEESQDITESEESIRETQDIEIEESKGFIMRVSVTNHSTSNQLISLKINSPNSHQNGQFVQIVRKNKKDKIMTILHLKSPLKTFKKTTINLYNIETIENNISTLNLLEMDHQEIFEFK